MKRPIILIIAVMTSLGACSTGNGGSNGDSLTRTEEVLALSDRIDDLSRSRFDAMPTTGKANFRGFGGLVIDPDDARGDGALFVVGDASVDADFRNATVTGQLTNLVGLREPDFDFSDPEDLDLADFDAVGGRVNLGSVGSQIGRDASEPGDRTAPNQFLTSYRGNLSTDGGRVRVIGTLDGRFLGTRVDNPANDFPIKALEAFDEDGVAVFANGDEAPVLFEIIAEQR